MVNDSDMKKGLFVFGLFLSSALAGPNWMPANMKLRRVLGAYYLVKREYDGILRPYNFLNAFSKVSTYIFVF